MKDDQGPRFRFEAAEAAFELGAVGHGGSLVAEGRVVDRGQGNVKAMTPEAACFVDAGAIEQALERGVEWGRAAEGGQIAPRPDERLLDGVLSLVGGGKG